MTDTPRLDLRSDPHDDVLRAAERGLGLLLHRATAAYGNQGETAGFESDRHTWVRLQWRRRGLLNEGSWTGAECASVIVGVAKPELLRSSRWLDTTRGLVWRADEMSLVRSKAVSASGSVSEAPELLEEWWSRLRTSLAALSTHPTHRHGMPQAHLSRRIAEVFGAELNTTIDEWRTAHADLHWGNLTAPECWLLDWEDWGLAPRGYDAATLWGFSLGAPALAERVLDEFADDLVTRSGRLARLLFCANAIRAFRRTGKTAPFTTKAQDAAAHLLPLFTS